MSSLLWLRWVAKSTKAFRPAGCCDNSRSRPWASTLQQVNGPWGQIGNAKGGDEGDPSQGGQFESLCRFGSADSIHVRRVESRRRFRQADSNRCVDSRRPTGIAAAIQGNRLESLCRFGSPNSIHVGRLESLLRFTPAASNHCVESRRPTRIAASIHGGRFHGGGFLPSYGRRPASLLWVSTGP